MAQVDLANLLNWTPGKTSKILNANVPLLVDVLDDLCFATGITIVEAVRDHGLEFVADLTPTELRVLERFRQLKPQEQDAMLTVFAVNRNTRLQERRALPPRPVFSDKKKRVP